MKSMQEPRTREIYDRNSAIYDKTFGALVRRRLETAITHLNIQPGERVLDLGIGTGASLRYYPHDQGRIFGIDLSTGMLRRCQSRMAESERPNATVVQGDALALPFADDSFDHVFISHVISVVSDPCQVVREAQRVAKPLARIVMLNHFQSANRLIALVEKWLSPLCTKLGWRSDLALADILRGTGCEVDYHFKLENLDLWETVVMSNNKHAAARTNAVAA